MGAADHQTRLQVQGIEQAHGTLTIEAWPARDFSQIAGLPLQFVYGGGDGAGELQGAQVGAWRDAVSGLSGDFWQQGGA